MQNSAENHLKQRMLELVASVATQEGYTTSALDYVHFIRSEMALQRAPVMYEPCICIILQGRKRAYFGDAEYTYDANQYLVVSAPLPFEVDTIASQDQPLFGLHVGINQTLATELALALEAAEDTTPLPRSPVTAGFMYATTVDEQLEQTVWRLLVALNHPLEAQILAPAIIRELYFRILLGEQGAALRAVLGHGGHFQKISRALSKIHQDLHSKLDVDTLAKTAGMSVPAFHTHFKLITATTPLQYIKALRLHQARLLMVRQGISAYAAATTVGYESSSQFSREFKRLFGRSPLDEVKQMRSVLRLQEAQIAPSY